jgi:MscS family membrane protein
MYDFLNSGFVRNFFIPAAIFFLFFFLSVPAVNCLSRLLKKISKKSGRTWGEKIDYSFHRPMHFTLVAIGLYVALSNCRAVQKSPVAAANIAKCFRSFLVIAVTWGFYRMSDSIEMNRTALAKKFDIKADQVLMPVFSGIIHFVLISLAVLIIAQEWSFSISGLLAGLGLGGLAFALAAKDMLANLFGGLVILLDHPFSIGDWVRTGDVEGTIEDINFRSLKIRTYSQAVVTVPNSMVASAPVANYSRMGKRRVEFTLAIKYGAPAEQLKSCAEKIRRLLAESTDIENGTFAVSLSSLGESGINFDVYYYTVASDYTEYLRVRESIYYAILEILDESHVSLAYPTSSVVLENGGTRETGE